MLVRRKEMELLFGKKNFVFQSIGIFRDKDSSKTIKEDNNLNMVHIISAFSSHSSMNGAIIYIPSDIRYYSPSHLSE